MDIFKDTGKVTVLFVCKNNSIRSQMAEAIVNSYYGGSHSAFSGGTEPTTINVNTIKVLKEISIDISNEKSKNIEIFKNMKFDHVITLCEDDKCHCFSNADNFIYKLFNAPNNSSKSEKLDSFRQIRDDIKEWISEMVESGDLG
jgi:arsenate reductase